MSYDEYPEDYSEFAEIPLTPDEYDPDSYRAGMEMGNLQAQLAGGQVSALALSVRQSNLRAADLIAMSYGYTVRAYEHRGGLVDIEVRRSEAVL